MTRRLPVEQVLARVHVRPRAAAADEVDVLELARGRARGRAAGSGRPCSSRKRGQVGLEARRGEELARRGPHRRAPPGPSSSLLRAPPSASDRPSGESLLATACENALTTAGPRQGVKSMSGRAVGWTVIVSPGVAPGASTATALLDGERMAAGSPPCDHARAMADPPAPSSGPSLTAAPRRMAGRRAGDLVGGPRDGEPRSSGARSDARRPACGTRSGCSRWRCSS